MPKTLPLSQSMFAVVDDIDFDRVAELRWSVSRSRRGGFYAASRSLGNHPVRMHRFILSAPAGIGVDHINHDGLDNRRENLRLCTQGQNNGNRLPTKGRSLPKGVVLQRGRYCARIQVDRKGLWLGAYPTMQEAALVYDHAALHHFGDFALLNCPDADESIREAAVRSRMAHPLHITPPAWR